MGPLLQAMVDVISSSGWLNPALKAMEMSQMVTQVHTPAAQQLHAADAPMSIGCCCLMHWNTTVLPPNHPMPTRTRHSCLVPAPHWRLTCCLLLIASFPVAQGTWEKDSVLMQLPHFTRELAAKAEADKIDNIFDLADMEVPPLLQLLIFVCRCFDTGQSCHLVLHNC